MKSQKKQVLYWKIREYRESIEFTSSDTRVFKL